MEAWTQARWHTACTQVTCTEAAACSVATTQPTHQHSLDKAQKHVRAHGPLMGLIDDDDLPPAKEKPQAHRQSWSGELGKRGAGGDQEHGVQAGAVRFGDCVCACVRVCVCVCVCAG